MKLINEESLNIFFLLTPKIHSAYLEDDFTVRQCLEKMKHHGYTAMPVIDQAGHYVGTVNEGDFLWHLLDTGKYDIKDQERYALKSIMRDNWNLPVRIDASIPVLIERVMEQNFVPVIDDRGMFMGIVTRKTIFKYYESKLKKDLIEE